MSIRDLAVAAFALLLSGPALAQRPAVSSIDVVGTEIVVALSDGKTLRSKDLAGAILDVRFEGRPIKVRIASVESDPGDKTGTVWLHAFEGMAEDGTWRNLCQPGPDGRQQGFPLKGTNGLEFTCTGGAVGKCVRFGYRPWATGPDGQSLARQHAACVRLVRGDYGGADQPWTSDGMSIDVYDPQGIQVAENAADQAFEAGWSTEGAVCVHHVRVRDNVSLAALEEKYPHLKGRTGAICTEEYARSLGAVVFNRSRP